MTIVCVTVDQVLTLAATRSQIEGFPLVTTVPGLRREGWSSSAVRRQLDARRWQRIGRAVLRHNGTPTTQELHQIALLNSGPRAALTSFTALAEWGLSGWERPGIHVLVPRGARLTPHGLDSVRHHYVGVWQGRAINGARRLHRPADAAAIAAGSFARPRPACGVLAAVVQQRLARPADVIDAIERSGRLRHRAQLLRAAHDIAQGSQALSEIDFVTLCRAAGLPAPTRQAVRPGPGRRRRYLDAQWILPSGRRVVVEVDGALHLAPRTWWDDQIRQNEFAIAGDTVLRFPSVLMRCERPLVIGQLSRALAD